MAEGCGNILFSSARLDDPVLNAQAQDIRWGWLAGIKRVSYGFFHMIGEVLTAFRRLDPRHILHIRHGAYACLIGVIEAFPYIGAKFAQWLHTREPPEPPPLPWDYDVNWQINLLMGNKVSREEAVQDEVLEMLDVFIEAGWDPVRVLLSAIRNRRISVIEHWFKVHGVHPDQFCLKYDQNNVGLLYLLKLTQDLQWEEAVPLIELFLQYGADPNLQVRHWEYCPLAWAVSALRPKVVKFLIEHGANPLRQSADTGHTLLHIVMSKSSRVDKMKDRAIFQIFELLLENGADPDATLLSRGTQQTPLALFEEYWCNKFDGNTPANRHRKQAFLKRYRELVEAYKSEKWVAEIFAFTEACAIGPSHIAR